MTMEEILKKLNVEDMEAFKETMAYCEKRVTADEGIPAIIGLDDLTREKASAYEGAASDEELKYLLAGAALVFAYLYETTEGAVDEEYPAIAPAMSAVAEQFFQMEENEIHRYREVVEAFLKKED